MTYKVQPSPDGLAQTFIIGEEFIGDESCAMVLGDNIFYGGGLPGFLKAAVDNAEEGNATIFGYYVNDPERFGIMEFDENWNILSVEENRRSQRAITVLQDFTSILRSSWQSEEGRAECQRRNGDHHSK